MDLSSGYDDQPVIDTRAASAARLADQAHTDFDRHKNVYVGVHVPLKHRHQKKRSSKNGHHRSEKRDRKNEKDNVPTPPVTPPGQRVQFILGADDEAEKKEAPTIFTEMEELHMGDDMEMEWKECARWVKFEEDVEEGGDRWSKPHVATLSLHSLFELRSCILTGTVLLDMDANHLTDIANLVLDNMVHKGQLQEVDREKVLNALLSRHHHQTRRSKAAMFPMAPSLASLRRNFSNPNKLSEQGSEKLHTSHSAHHLTPCPPSPLLMGESPGGNSFPRIASSASMRYENSFSTTPEEPGGTSTPPRINSTASFAKDHLHVPRRGSLMPGFGERRGSVPSKHFMRKIPEGSEASNVLVGEVDFLKHPIIAFVRLSHGLLLGDLTEVPIPTRFLFFMLGPQGNQKQYHEVGRAIATLMSDEVFHNVAYKAKNRQDLLAGIDEFLDQVTVLPPGEWDPNIRIEPPSNIPSQEGRKYAGGQDNGDGDKEEEYDSKEELKRTGRFFGGLIDDVKRKAPHYLSDFKDGLNLQCLSSVLFLYFACITPVITFGGLLGDATDNYQAALENIFSAAICGTTYHLLAGQPLTIIGSTGPILVYETLMYNFCKGNGLEYLPFRVWVGLWTSFILLVMVATDASALVKYFTRFVEESFAALIALIFIVEAFKKLYHITDHYMVKKWWLESSCICVPPIEKNLTTPTSIMDIFLNDTNMTFPTPASMPLGYSLATSSPLNVTDTTPFNDYEVFPTSESDGIPWANLSQHDCLIVHHGRWVGENCDYAPDVFLMSVLLMFGTFFLASILKSMKTERFFPTMVRGVICDFAVFISVLVFVGVDAVFGVDTPKLLVPIEFKPTRPDRTWFINPVSGNPWWVGIAAVIPALLAVILIFMDQQITAVIVSRKEHKLKKGAGYHLDLFIVAILIGITSLLGLPWFVAATVLSLNHVNSLKMESDCSAPGEKPKFLGVRENRVTGLIVFLLIGLSVLFTSILRLVPMPVLYGVFLYMGFSSLGGIQFWDRLLLVLMPPKHQPDYVYLRHVPLKRVHLFTFIQLMCLVILWVIKSTDASLVFPIMVLALVFVRKLMDYLFIQDDLEYLDDKMPEIIKRKKADKEMVEEEYRERSRTLEGADFLEVVDQTKDEIGGNITIPVEAIQYNPKSKTLNISEEVAKTAIWKTLAGDTSQKRKKSRRSKKSRPDDLTLKDGPNNVPDRKSATKNGELSPLIEEAGGIVINIPPPWQDNDCKKRSKDVEEGKSPLIKVQAPSPADSPDLETTV
ncbi:electrogenic sodium bicarbonate cotransporter 1-like [Branchiostoma floridae]|uniref:Anion exchange protein n=1 Tax=Branchiostoma floridae TaxID=7739 RepID=A0A9J7HJ01_BRAFL|nr:electrogenic sodium bicarbonate cotransporter 1-like [Branchiostoma floridae]